MLRTSSPLTRLPQFLNHPGSRLKSFIHPTKMIGRSAQKCTTSAIHYYMNTSERRASSGSSVVAGGWSAAGLVGRVRSGLAWPGIKRGVELLGNRSEKVRLERRDYVSHHPPQNRMPQRRQGNRKGCGTPVSDTSRKHACTELVPDKMLGRENSQPNKPVEKRDDE
jgi:hypothetical protein